MASISSEQETRNQIEKFKRDMLADVLQQCGEQQQAFFHRAYPDKVKTEQLDQAINLCKRTIIRNQKYPERVK